MFTFLFYLLNEGEDMIVKKGKKGKLGGKLIEDNQEMVLTNLFKEVGFFGSAVGGDLH